MAVTGEVGHGLAERFAAVLPHLNERQRRLVLASEARSLGHGGVRAVALAAGVGETTVRKGVFELEAGEDPLPEGRVRRVGGGRKNAEDIDPQLVPALVEPDERGDPESPLRWTTKSLRHVADELTRSGHPGRLRRWAGCSRLPGSACRLTSRPSRAPSIRTETLSSAISTSRSKPIKTMVTRHQRGH